MPDTRVYSKTGGTVTYGDIGDFSVWGPALQCAAKNATNAAIQDYGMRLMAADSVGWQNGFQGGLEFRAPAGEELAQVSFDARAPLGNQGQQGGISGLGGKLVWEFAGNGATASGASIPVQGSWLSVGGANEVQHASMYRIGLKCDPDNAAQICVGPGNSVLLQNLVVTLIDKNIPSVDIEATPLSDGEWVRGEQEVKFTAQDVESGLRQVEVFVDDNLAESKLYSCQTVSGMGAGDSSIPMAKQVKPCPQTPQSESFVIDTAKYGDGEHTLKVCATDFGSWTPYWGEGPSSCKSTAVRIDNTKPAPAEEAEATPVRIPRVVKPEDVEWNNPGTGDPGSPIRKAIYEIVDQNGKVAVTHEVVATSGPADRSASQSTANNIQAIPTMNAPDEAGSYTLRVTLEDMVGFQSRVSTVPLRYSCSDTGGTPLPEADLAFGVVEPGKDKNRAKGLLALDQGEKADLVGKIRGPGGMPINNADVCVNAKPVTDPQLELLTDEETNGDGNFRSALPPGPSRNLVAVFRQEHREVWSEQAKTEVTVEPTLKIADRSIYAGQKIRFSGKIPGPHADGVVVVIQVKTGETWQAIRRYRTRNGGKYVQKYHIRKSTITRPLKFVTRTQVRKQVGYPFVQGDSKPRTITIYPANWKKKAAGTRR